MKSLNIIRCSNGIYKRWDEETGSSGPRKIPFTIISVSRHTIHINNDDF